MHRWWRYFVEVLPIGRILGGGIWLRGDTSQVHGLAVVSSRVDAISLRMGSTSVTSRTSLVLRGSMARRTSPSRSFPGLRLSIRFPLAAPGHVGITLHKRAGVMNHRARRFRFRMACVPF